MLKKACDILEIKYDYLKNLKGLQIKELRKIMQVQHLAEGGPTNMKELMKLNH